MCGLCGIVYTESLPFDEETLSSVQRALTHRGPDASGSFSSTGVWFGHRRLKVIDLESGNQPMVDTNRNIALVYNGEIYNFKELRAELEGLGETFRTQSDTEVLLKCYARFGIRCADRFRGMFAFAIWDGRTNSLLLARDGFGIKPLYYTVGPHWLAFASEFQALSRLPTCERKLNPIALRYFLTYDAVPAPETLFQGVKKLSAGELLIWKNGDVQNDRISWPQQPKEIRPYNSESISQLRTVLEDSVKRHLISDVPVGVFLSGGLDSSYIAAVASRHVKQLKTFSISFSETSFDESSFANDVACHIGSNHTDIPLTPDVAKELLLRCPDFIDEPLADPAVLAMYLLSQEARRHVTVALSGEGADELFLGYPTYKAHTVIQAYQAMPRILRKLVRGVSNILPASDRNFALDFIARRFLSGADLALIPRHITWMSAFPPSSNSIFHDDIIRSISDQDGLAPAFRVIESAQTLSPPILASLLDLALYLQDGILMRTDKVSMKHSLEVRVPFLDSEVANCAWSLPLDAKLSLFCGKRALREVAADVLPHHIVNRRKKGFGLPISEWLKGPLRALTQDFLSSDTLKAQGVFNHNSVSLMLQEHEKGVRNHRKALWALIVFQLWYQKWFRNS